MNKGIISHVFRFFILIIIQILIFNNIQFGGYINPYIYIVFILLLPFETPGWLILLSSFFIGIFIDMFSDTLGMHAAASVFIAYLRNTVIKLISTRDSFETGAKPTIYYMGLKWILKYVIVLVLLHHILLFYLEAFSFSDIGGTFNRAILSSLFTIIIIIIIYYLFGGKKK